jgi:pilus assembly protein CpaC
MHPKRNARRPLLWGLVLVAGLSATATYGKQPMQPMPTVGEVQVDAKTGALIVPVGALVRFDPKLTKSEVLTDIIVSREDVLGVRIDPNDPGKLLLTGKAAGLSQLTLVFKEAPRRVYDVIVQPDLNLLRTLIKRTVPTAAVDVQPGIGNVIVMSGYVTSPQDADIVTRLVASAVGNVNNVINAVQVGGGQHVQIDVVVASVDRTAIRQRGFDFFIGGTTANFASIVSGLITGTGTVGGLPTVSQAANLQLGIVPTPFLGALQALRRENIAKFIAEPRVVTQSGRPAFFRAGGQQAIISPTSGITGPGVQLQPFGTELEVLPIVYGNGQIWLDINPRITAVNNALGITVGGAVSPGFTEQQVRASVMLESGQTYAIGGLIQNSVSADSSRVPILGDLPYAGVLFSRVNHQQVESELVILVTPRLVGPMNCDQVPHRLPGRETRNPDDYELFLEGILEAPRGQRKVWNGRCYNAAWKCDPTAAIFPCVGNVCTGYNGAAGGCNGAAATGKMMAPVPPPPAGGIAPKSLPPLPGETGAVSIPAVPPPVVVFPETPRN